MPLFATALDTKVSRVNSKPECLGNWLNRLKRQLLQIPIAKQLNAQRVDQVPRLRVCHSPCLEKRKRRKPHHPLNRLKRQLLQIPIPKQLNAQRVDQVTRLRVRHSPCLKKRKRRKPHHPLNRLKRQLLQIPIAKQLNAQRVNQVPRLRVCHNQILVVTGQPVPSDITNFLIIHG